MDRKNESKGNDYSCLLFVFFLIFATDSLITITINVQTIYYYGFRCIAICMCPVLLLKTVNIRSMSLRAFSYLIVLASVMTLCAFFNSEFTFIIAIKLVYIMLGYAAVEYFGSDKIIDTFVNVMLFIATFSFICYLLFIINPGMFDILPNIRIVAAKSKRVSNFSNAIFSVLPKNTYGFPRNYGIFAEPGVYQVYLIFAMIGLLYRNNTRKAVKLVILIASILTTFSTTGYIVAVCLIAFYFFTNYDVKPIHRVLGIGLVVLLIYAITSNDYVINLVFGKMQNGGDQSTTSRVYSFVINLLIWMKNPLLGVGSMRVTQLGEELALTLAHTNMFHNTNTFMYTLSCYGIVLFGFEIQKTIAFCRKMTNGKMLQALVMFAIIFLCLSGENLTHSLWLETILFCGMDYNNMEEIA